MRFCTILKRGVRGPLFRTILKGRSLAVARIEEDKRASSFRQGGFPEQSCFARCSGGLSMTIILHDSFSKRLPRTIIWHDAQGAVAGSGADSGAEGARERDECGGLYRTIVFHDDRIQGRYFTRFSRGGRWQRRGVRGGRGA